MHPFNFFADTWLWMRANAQGDCCFRVRHSPLAFRRYFIYVHDQDEKRAGFEYAKA